MTIAPIIQVYVALFILRDQQVVLAKHKKDNLTFYTLIGGKVESGETALDAAIREAGEEAGIQIKQEQLEFSHLLSRKINSTTSSVVIFFNVLAWDGEPYNHEPEKHEEVAWHLISHLPHSFRAHHRQAFDCWTKKISYSEYSDPQ